MRLVIDTNIWIHYLIQSALEQIDSLLTDPEIVILFSNELLNEFLEVSARPKFSRYFQSEDISDLLLLFESRFPPIEVHSLVKVCRDEQDNFLLALCKDGKADYLLTGDADLLVMKQFETTKIISLSEIRNLKVRH
jgi:putative PIN family toxin of toxin-antitoxin system